MLGNFFKDDWGRIIRPTAVLLHRSGIKPNYLTGLGLLMSLGAAYFYSLGRLRQAGAALFLAGLCDAVDGPLARVSGHASNFGSFLDSVIDRYSEFFVFIGLAFWLSGSSDRLSLVVLFFALMGSIMVSYTRARSELFISQCQVGLMERPERLLVLIVFSLAGEVKAALWIIALGANLTALRRIYHTYLMTGEGKSGAGIGS